MSLPTPMTAFLLAISTYTLTLALVRPCSSLRLIIFTLMLSYIALALTPSSASFRHPLYANLTGGSVFNFALLYLDRILLGRWFFEARGPISARGGQQVARSKRDDENVSKRTKVRVTQHTAVFEQLWWAAENAFDTRFVSTQWEVVNVPPFSWRNPNWVPIKLEFLRKNAVVSAVCLLLLDATRLLAAPAEQNAILFGEERVGFFTRLGDVSSEEVVMRFVSAGMYWVVTFLLFQAVYSGTATIMVGLELSEVERWRPLFGRYLDAWSIRQFWGLAFRPSYHACALRVTLTCLKIFLASESPPNPLQPRAIHHLLNPRVSQTRADRSLSVHLLDLLAVWGTAYLWRPSIRTTVV